MRKILLLTPSGLDGAKIQQQLLALNPGVVWLTDPTRVEGYLASQEIGLVIVHLDSGDESVNVSFAPWISHRGLAWILAGDGVPPQFAPLLEREGIPFREVPGGFLVRLVGEVVCDFCPDLCLPPPAGKSVRLERRGPARREKSLRVFLHGGASDRPVTIRSRTVDISSCGARVVTPDLLPRGTHVVARILLPVYGETVKCEADVVWSRCADEGGCQAGIFFRPLESPDRFNLAAYLYRDRV